jgi:hypothetical protein
MLDKDTEKSVFAPRKKKEKKIRRLFNLYSVSLLRAHARARLHRGNARRHERKKKERFCVQSFGGRKKEVRAEIEKTTTTVRGGFLEKKCARLRYREVNLKSASSRRLLGEEEEEARERSAAVFQINRTKTRKLLRRLLRLLLLLLHPLKSATEERTTARLRRRRR